MSAMPDEPAAFAQRVATMLRALKPDCEVELNGTREMLVNGRRLDLENLARMVACEPQSGEQIVSRFLERLMEGDAISSADLPFDFVRDRIMPRIQPERIFQHLSREMVAHVPFVNDTVVVFVTDLPQMTVSITTEQLMRWGVEVDQLDDIARANLRSYAPELEMQVVESRDGGRAVIVAEQDGYDAARLLHGELYDRLAPKLGGDFLVATPARDMLVAMTQGPGAFIQRLKARVEDDYQRLPYPICTDFFYVCRDGVAGTKQTAA
jgi:uncharacterized protein YtpQ (UPF0354 family)